MDDEVRRRMAALGTLSRDDIGVTEENVKINFVVRLLECLGHDRLDFEYRYTDIILQKNLPQSARVIIETKSYDKNLLQELPQLERYCHEVQPLLGILANGTQILIFSYFWRYRPYFERMIYCISREELTNDSTIDTLDMLLSRKRLKSGNALEYVNEREREIEKAEGEIKRIQKEYDEQTAAVDRAIQELVLESQQLEQRIKELRAQSDNLVVTKNEKTAAVYKACRMYPTRESLVSRPPQGFASRVKSSRPRSDDNRMLGRQGNDGLEDYLLPVIKLMYSGMGHIDAFKQIADTLEVTRNTVSDRCARGIKLNVAGFVEHVRSRTIVQVLKDKYPDRRELIDKEIGGRATL